MKEKEFTKFIHQETWFHGTTLSAWKNLCKKKVLADYNKGTSLDFGFGFYLTPKFKQAESYIVRMLPFLESDDIEEKVAVVIEFELDFTKLIEQYNYKVFYHYDMEFAKFVFNNRKNPENKVHNYDFVIGVMSDSNPDRLIAEYESGFISKEDVLQGLLRWTSMIQCSLHNQTICDILRVRKATIIDTGEELDTDDYNES